jgi:hypothetical protein
MKRIMDALAQCPLDTATLSSLGEMTARDLHRTSLSLIALSG